MLASGTAEVLTRYVCPSLGCVMASIMFAAPVADLRDCLRKGSLGVLNPFPWVMMTGNCLGWVVYGYYQRDAFIVAANLPGLILSLWLNMGAAKLQYRELSEQRGLLPAPTPPNENDPATSNNAPNHENDAVDEVTDALAEDLVMVPQELSLLRMLVVWAIIIVIVGWLIPAPSNDGFSKTVAPATIVGVIVNINLVFFYGAPLQVIFKVISDGSSESIHVPTMVMNWVNTSFWTAYGIGILDPLVIFPNVAGLCLGIAQGILCCLYPSKPNGRASTAPLVLEGASFFGIVEPSEHHRIV